MAAPRPALERALRRAAAALYRAVGGAWLPAAPLGRGSRALLLAICVWIALWNLQSYCGPRARFGEELAAVLGALGVPRSWLWFGELLSLHQSWDLFAPAPNREDGWFVLPAQMVTGELRGLRRQTLDFARPPLPSAWYVAAAATPATASRWLQYHLRIWEEARKPERQQDTQLFSALVQWHCRRHRPPLARLALVFDARTDAAAERGGAAARAPADLAGGLFGMVPGAGRAASRARRQRDGGSLGGFKQRTWLHTHGTTGSRIDVSLAHSLRARAAAPILRTCRRGGGP